MAKRRTPVAPPVIHPEYVFMLTRHLENIRKDLEKLRDLSERALSIFQSKTPINQQIPHIDILAVTIQEIATNIYTSQAGAGTLMELHKWANPFKGSSPEGLAYATTRIRGKPTAGKGPLACQPAKSPKRRRPAASIRSTSRRP